MDNNTLVETIKTSNNFKAVGLLYDTYAPALYGSILKFVPEKSLAGEILLNSFLQIAKRLKEFDPKWSLLFCWMLRICLVQCKQRAGIEDSEIRKVFER